LHLLKNSGKFDKKDGKSKMKNIYGTFIALTLATAATFKAKAQTSVLEKKDNFMETIYGNDAVAKSTTATEEKTITFEEAQKQQKPELYFATEEEDTFGITSAWVEHPAFEEDSTDKDPFVVVDVIAPEVKAADNDTPWETTTEGADMVQTWQRIQRENGNHNALTPEDIANLQKIHLTSHRVCALEAGLKNYVMDAEDMLRAKTDSMGVELERSAVKEANGPGGQCYSWVKHILMGTKPIAYMEGTFACEGAEWLRKCPNVVELTTTFDNMDKVIPGAVTVFGRGPGAYAGHIFITGSGNRNLLKEYEAPSGKKYWYSPARDVSDKNRNANITGNRGNKGHYAAKPQVFFTKNSTLASTTVLKIGYQYTRENSSHMFLTTQDVYNSILRINMKSAELAAGKIMEAQGNVDGFVRAENQTAYHQYPNPRVNNPRSKGKISKKKGQTKRYAQQTTIRGRIGRT
jgi:hypothetical protein